MARNPRNLAHSLHSQQKLFKCLRQFEKIHSGKIVKQKDKIVSTEKILCLKFCNII